MFAIFVYNDNKAAPPLPHWYNLNCKYKMFFFWWWYQLIKETPECSTLWPIASCFRARGTNLHGAFLLAVKVNPLRQMRGHSFYWFVLFALHATGQKVAWLRPSYKTDWWIEISCLRSRLFGSAAVMYHATLNIIYVAKMDHLTWTNFDLF